MNISLRNMIVFLVGIALVGVICIYQLDKITETSNENLELKFLQYDNANNVLMGIPRYVEISPKGTLGIVIKGNDNALIYCISANDDVGQLIRWSP